MHLPLYVTGLVLGFSIAAPVGPIGVLCIRRTLAEGRLIGFVTGLGAATADAVYGAVAAFGLTAVSGALVAQQSAIRLIGGVFLAYLGIRTLLARPASRAVRAAMPGNPATAYASTVVLTLTNPATILSFAAIFAGLGLAAAGRDYPGAALLVLGVFCGSALWWLLLSGVVGLLRARVTPEALRWVNVASGILLLGFGVLALASGWSLLSA